MSKIKLLVEIDEEDYGDFCDWFESVPSSVDGLPVVKGKFNTALYDAKPYNPSGDAISREALKEQAIWTKVNNGVELIDIEVVPLDAIDNAPPVPQVTVFTENADENAVADLKAELQSVIESRPNEQIAWEQGYEAGLAQGKQDRPQGGLTEVEKKICKMYLKDLDKTHTCNEYKLLKSLIDNAQTAPERPQGEWEKDNIGIYCSVCKMHLDVETSFCPLCGADMRKGGAE